LLAAACWIASVACIGRSRGAGAPRGGWFAISCLAVLVSFLGKAYGLMVPFVFLVLDVWPLRRCASRRDLLPLVLEKAPLLALTAGFASTAYWARGVAAGAIKTLAEHSPLERMTQAPFGLCFYPLKTLAPLDLSPMYDLPADIRPSEPRFLLASLVAVLVTAVLVLRRRRWPAGLAAWSTYALLILPMLGLTQGGAQLVADRYSYASCIPFALLAAGLVALGNRPSAASRSEAATRAALGLALVAALGVLTWRQTALWRDSESILSHGIAVTGSPRLLTNLAVVHNQRAFEDPEHRGEHLARALETSEQALDVATARGLVVPEMHLHRGTILMNLGRIEEAELELRRSVSQNPRSPQALVNLGLALNRGGRFAEAIPILERAIERAPESPDAWRYLGLAHEGAGDARSAARAYERALELHPGQPLAVEGLARVRALAE
jgi:tetratricopeptide (TPR) repeat protein